MKSIENVKTWGDLNGSLKGDRYKLTQKTIS